MTAAKKAFGEDREMEATFNEASGRVDLSQIIVVADPVTQPAKEIALEEANRFNLQADVGDELLFQIFYDDKDQARAEEQDAKYGALLKLNRAWKTFGRFAAQTAKQVILQRVREAERENVFNQYRDKKGELSPVSCAASSAATSSLIWADRRRFCPCASRCSASHTGRAIVWSRT